MDTMDTVTGLNSPEVDYTKTKPKKKKKGTFKFSYWGIDPVTEILNGNKVLQTLFRV